MSAMRCLLVTLLLASLLYTFAPQPFVAGQICFPCTVSSICANLLPAGVTNVTVQLPATSVAAGNASCLSLQSDLYSFITTSLNSNCSSQIAAFACSSLYLAATTESGCNVSTIGQNTSYANNNTLFQQTCSSEISCLGYAEQSEVIAAGACSNFANFFAAIIQAPTPTNVTCAPCNFTACYNGTSGTSLIVYTGGAPGYPGAICPSFQAGTAAIINSPASQTPAGYAAALYSTCAPLAAMAAYQSQGQSQAALCAAGYDSQIYDQVLFAEAAQYNLTFQQYCYGALQATYNQTVVTALNASGFCLSPHQGVLVYGLELLAQNGLSSSSSGGTVYVNVTSSSIQSSSSSSTAGFIANITSSTGNVAPVSARGGLIVFVIGVISAIALLL